MKSIVTSLFLLPFVFQPVQAEWRLKNSTDPLTDASIAIATSTGSNGGVMTIRCEDSKLEAYVALDDFIDNDDARVRYRVDKGELYDEEWSPSTRGIAVFSPEPARLARHIIKGNRIIIEVFDYRGTSHRVNLDLSGSRYPVEKVMSECNVSTVSLNDMYSSVSEKIALDVEKWSQDKVSVAKEILHSLGRYNGPINGNIGNELLVSVQMFYDDYIRDCKAGKVKGVNCESYLILLDNHNKYGTEMIEFDVYSYLYESAKGDLKKKAGKL